MLNRHDCVQFIQVELTENSYTGTLFKVRLIQDTVLFRVRFRQVSLFSKTINHKDVKMALDRHFNSKFTVLPVDILFVCKYICKYIFFSIFNK